MSKQKQNGSWLIGAWLTQWPEIQFREFITDTRSGQISSGNARELFRSRLDIKLPRWQLALLRSTADVPRRRGRAAEDLLFPKTICAKEWSQNNGIGWSTERDSPISAGWMQKSEKNLRNQLMKSTVWKGKRVEKKNDKGVHWAWRKSK